MGRCPSSAQDGEDYGFEYIDLNRYFVDPSDPAYIPVLRDPFSAGVIVSRATKPSLDAQHRSVLSRLGHGYRGLSGLRRNGKGSSTDSSPTITCRTWS
jgi:hypothetical protein